MRKGNATKNPTGVEVIKSRPTAECRQHHNLHMPVTSIDLFIQFLLFTYIADLTCFPIRDRLPTGTLLCRRHSAKNNMHVLDEVRVSL